METVKMNVVVHKASVPIMQGETLEQFVCKLRDAAKAHVLKKLNMSNGDSWMVEAFGDSAIVAVYKDKGTAYYATPYKRIDNGDFEFGSITEVEKFTVYKPKSDLEVTKALVDVSKPFPNEHAARQTDPGKYDKFRRAHPKGFPAGVDVIYGIKNNKSEIQTIRFDAKLWTVAKAKRWLKDHNFKTNIEAASKKVEKAVWTRAFINDLPDSSFAVVLPGGEKDKEGKTVPRSLRKFPYKDANGKVDLPHLRNALARLPQAKIPASAKETARRKLMAAARQHLASYKKPVKKGLLQFGDWVQTEKDFWRGVI